MKINLKKGFTLIELLVVVAIIGILASVVLASLNTARAKGSDATVKADMANIRAQAELWYDDNGQKYNVTIGTALAGTGGAGAVCGVTTGMYGDVVVSRVMSHIATQMASTSTMTCTTDTSGQKWAVSVSALKGGGPWCVDNNGHAGAVPDVATAGVCQ